MRVTPKSGLRGARRFLNASDEEVPEASYRDLADLAGVVAGHTACLLTTKECGENNALNIVIRAKWRHNTDCPKR
jgi:hypothetical protein